MKLHFTQKFLDSLKDEPDDMWCPHGFAVGCPICIEELKNDRLRRQRDDSVPTDENVPHDGGQSGRASPDGSKDRN